MKKRVILIAGILLCLILLAAGAFWLLEVHRQEESFDAEYEETEEETIEEPAEEPEETNPPEEEPGETVPDASEEAQQADPEGELTEEPEEPAVSQEVVYPAPEYDFQVEECYLEIEGLESEYTIAFVNDIHMVTDLEPGNVTVDNLSAVRARYELMFITEDGVHAKDLWPEIVKFLNYHDFDAVIFAGDLLDYCSNSNIIALSDGFRALKYPKERMMYLRSDHDYSGAYGGGYFTENDGFFLQTFILDGDRGWEKKQIELDDLVILGFTRSYRNLSENGVLEMEETIFGDKPVIFATHVPFYSTVDETLAERSMEVRNRIYYWSNEGSSYAPNPDTQRLIDDIYSENSRVEQIFAAHLHASWDGYVTENLKEHIFAPAYQGKIGIIHVTGAGKDR